VWERVRAKVAERVVEGAVAKAKEGVALRVPERVAAEVRAKAVEQVAEAAEMWKRKFSKPCYGG
jgi:hypothetical protein